MAKRKDDRIHFRIKADLKARYYAACTFREDTPTNELTRHIAAYVQEAEREMKERGIDPVEYQKEALV